MHTYVKTLQRVASRSGPSRILSFDTVHVFKTLQLISKNGHVSRELLCKELQLGEGTIKTLMKHLKIRGLIESSNAGTKMTKKGESFFFELQSTIPRETNLTKCEITLGKYNYAVLVKGMSSAIKSGIEQRDAAIMMGASGATTLLFRNNKFFIPNTDYDAFRNNDQVERQLIDTLRPEEKDIIIIGTDNTSLKRAELAAKKAGLITIMAHEKH
jgi:uncharacterized protein DUF4443/CggR-like protein